MPEITIRVCCPTCSRPIDDPPLPKLPSPIIPGFRLQLVEVAHDGADVRRAALTSSTGIQVARDLRAAGLDPFAVPASPPIAVPTPPFTITTRTQWPPHLSNEALLWARSFGPLE